MDDFELESEFEAFVDYVKAIQDEQNRRGTMQMINPACINAMRSAVDVLHNIIREEELDAKIDFGISEFSGCGYVSIEIADAFILRDADKFCAAFNKLDNCEIQIAHGKVQINFMAYGVTTSQLLPDEE